MALQIFEREHKNRFFNSCRDLFKLHGITKKKKTKSSRHQHGKYAPQSEIRDLHYTRLKRTRRNLFYLFPPFAIFLSLHHPALRYPFSTFSAGVSDDCSVAHKRAMLQWDDIFFLIPYLGVHPILLQGAAEGIFK